MRRNNGWLAVLALSVVLSILRNSLAGERYPLDYANAELPVNLNETVYEARIPNRATLNSENQSNPISWNSPKLSSTIKPSSGSSSRFPENGNTISTKDSSKVISWRATEVADTNLPDKDRNDDRSFFENALFDSIHDESKHEDPPTKNIFTEQSNKLRTSKSKVQVVKRSSSFDTGTPRLSTWIGGGTIKEISKRSKRVTRRFTGSITSRRRDRETLEAIQRRGELAERGFPYYGHVKVSSRDDNSLTILAGEKGAKGFTKDPRGNVIERSDTVNGRQTTKDVEKGDIEASRSSKSTGLSEKIVDKRYSSRRNSVFPALVDGELDEKYEERKLTREKLDGRLVYSLMNDRQRSRRSIQNSRQIPGEKSGISTAGRVINVEAKYFSRDSRSSNRDSGNDRFEADGREWASHHSSRFGGSPYVLVSHKSTAKRHRPWNTLQSNGISSKQRSTIGNDDPRDSGTQYSSSIRGKRDSVRSGEKLISNSSGNEKTSSNVTFHGATNDSLDNNKVDNENDVEERLEFKFTQENFNNDVESNSMNRLEDNATVLNNESELMNFDGIELKNFVLNASNENDSQLQDVDNSRNSGTSLDVQQFMSNTLNNSKLETINEFDSINHDVDETSTRGGKIEENFESDLSDSKIQVFNLTSLNINKYSSNDTKLTINISTSSLLNYSINHDVDKTSTSGAQLDEKLNFNSTNLNISKHFSNDTKATSTKNNTQLEARSSTFRNETITIVPPTKDSLNETKFNRSRNNTEHTSTVSNTNNSISTNKSVSTNPDKRTAFTDRTKLDTSTREIDVPADEVNKTMPEGVSTLSNVTKQAEDVFVNSLRSSVAAPRNATYLRHDMNSLAVASFAWKSTSPSQYNGRNADDPFRNSSTVKSSRIVENFKIIAHPERSFINPMEQTKSKPSIEHTNESRSVISKMYQSEQQRINDEAVGSITSMQSSSSSSDRNANMHKGKHNGTVIVGKNEVAVSSKSTEPLNQNTQLDISEIRANEPIIGILSKNATRAQPLSASSLDNGTVNEVNPRDEDKGNIDDLSYRSTFDPVSTVTDLINDHPMKERRKSRSSKVGETSLGYDDAGMKIEYSLTSETSTSMWSNDTVPRDTVSSREIDSFPEKADNDVSETITLDQPTEFISRIANNSEENILSMENVTFPSTDVYQYSNEVETSTVVTTNEEDEQLLHFDMIVSSSLEPNDEDFHVTVDDVSSQGIDNSSHESESRNQWPVKHSAVVEGDLVLGGLMMVHEREDSVTCGPVMPQGGVQALEAMLYTLDRLNDREIVPGVKIGAHILDDCDKDTYGLEMAVDFIKGSISNIDGAEYHCNKTAVRKVISGVVGAASSVTSIQVANLLRLFRIPQVSFFSTSPELSNKQRFEYFTRTIPSDHYQVKAMVDIVLEMGWSYVSIIYEESNYGIKAFEELEELLGKYDICIAIKEKLVKDSGVAEETAYDNIVLKLLTKPRAKGCIIFGSDQEVAGVMRAVRRCNATGAFSWIGSDGWSARGLVSNGNEPEVEGTLSVQPQANPVKGFEEYFLNLTVENNRRNPWFVEFWEDHFQCRYPNASTTPYNQQYTKPCTTKERLTKQDTAFEDQLQFVSDAVMAFAYAFRDMHRDLCQGKPGLCEAMKPTKGTELLKYLKKVDFEGLSGDKFKFDKNGDGPARYNIIHFKQIEPGKYKWVRVGKYLEGELRLNMSEIQFKLGHPQPPESVCSLPCEVGQAKKYVEGERCCWHCFNCTQYQIRHPKDETQCIPCRQGTVPDETHSTCRDIPEEFLRPESGWAIGAMAFSATGIFITMFVCGVFLKHNDTPVVRASGRELSYVLLSGILLCYLVTFALVLRPTDIVCGIQRFAAGFCFTVVYAALLTKTNRISRIFNASKHSAKRPSFISPRSQLIICSGLVFVQILINGVWMIIDPAKAMHYYPTREDNLLVCNSYIDASYMIAFAYPIMLIVVCTVYAVLTRKIPEAFNESKHIGFTMYTTCVIWLAFVPLYFGTGNNVALRITSMSVTISLSASVTIACLFSPKLYIILIRPERNVRQSMMPARYSTTKSSAVTATNASSMIAPVTLTAATCDQNKAVKKHIITTIDCSTQSEYYELEVKDQKNGKPPPTVTSRSTQTSSNNDKDSSSVLTSTNDTKESGATTKQLNNNSRIGNGPVSQSDVSL